MVRHDLELGKEQTLMTGQGLVNLVQVKLLDGYVNSVHKSLRPVGYVEILVDALDSLPA